MSILISRFGGKQEDCHSLVVLDKVAVDFPEAAGKAAVDFPEAADRHRIAAVGKVADCIPAAPAVDKVVR